MGESEASSCKSLKGISNSEKIEYPGNRFSPSLGVGDSDISDDIQRRYSMMVRGDFDDKNIENMRILGINDKSVEYGVSNDISSLHVNDDSSTTGYAPILAHRRRMYF